MNQTFCVKGNTKPVELRLGPEAYCMLLKSQTSGLTDTMVRGEHGGAESVERQSVGREEWGRR